MDSQAHVDAGVQPRAKESRYSQANSIPTAGVEDDVYERCTRMTGVERDVCTEAAPLLKATYWRYK